MKLTYTCSLVSRGFKLVDQAVGYDMQDAARRFLMDGMVMLAVEIKGLTCKGFQTGSIAAEANRELIISFRLYVVAT